MVLLREEQSGVVEKEDEDEDVDEDVDEDEAEKRRERRCARFFSRSGRQWARGKGALDSVTWSHPLDHLHYRL